MQFRGINDFNVRVDIIHYLKTLNYSNEPLASRAGDIFYGNKSLYGALLYDLHKSLVFVGKRAHFTTDNDLYESEE